MLTDIHQRDACFWVFVLEMFFQRMNGPILEIHFEVLKTIVWKVEKAKVDLELNSVEHPVLSFTHLSPTTSLSAPLSTKEQVTC